MNLFDRLQKMAEAQPLICAVDMGASKATYQEFCARTLQIASNLAQKSRHERILILLPKSVDCYATMFASLYLGSFYCCINLDSPIEKIAKVFQKFQPDVVITDRTGKAHFGSLLNGLEILESETLDIAAPDIAGRPPQNNGDVAYVMFTSGSTGEPKGVVIPRTALEHYTEWALDTYQVTPEDRWSQHPNVAFDLSVLDVFGALCGGATLVPIVSPLHRLLPTQAIRDLKISIWNSVPSVVDLMIQSKRLDSSYLAPLRLVTFCGEPLLGRHARALFAAKPTLRMLNTYGPTEATVSCTAIEVTPQNIDAVTDHSVAIGRGIQDMGIQLVGGATPDEGELVITGPQLAIGYWNDEGLSQKVFRTVELGGRKERAYFTGDWAYQKNSQIFCAGRIDSQVKIKGHRVELGEIDAALQALGVDNSATIYLNDVLYSFVVSSGSLRKAELIEKLKIVLDAHFVPETFYLLPRIPMNANDKIDFGALKEMVKSEKGLHAIE